MRIGRLLTAALAAGSAFGAITNVTVETSHRQAAISYAAPDANACTVDVYRDSAMTILAHDTNPAIFGAGSNQDDRAGSLSSGRRRVFIAGQIPLPGWTGYSPVETTSAAAAITAISRASDVATVDTATSHGLTVNDHVSISGVVDVGFNDSSALVKSVVSATRFTYANAGGNGSSSGGSARRVNRFSRALQADAPHWFRITCGADTYAGSFRTRTIPLGQTYGELTAFDWTSAPMKYLEPTLPEIRGYETVDPVTGLLAKRVALNSDCTTACSGDLPRSFDGGNQTACPQQKTNGGYHCTMESTGRMNRMYWHGDDGTIRYLGHLRVPAGSEWAAFTVSDPQAYWDTEDPWKYYTLFVNSAMGNKIGLMRLTLASDNAVSPNTAVAWTGAALTPAAGGKALPDLIRDFDPAFPATTYTQCWLAAVQGEYLAGYCRSRQQDSPAWLWALRLGDKQPLGACTDCLRIVAAAPMYANPKTRWCGNHYSNFVPSPNALHFVAQKLAGGGATGPWEVVLQNPGGAGANDTAFTVDGEPVANAASLPYDGSTYMQDAAAGDVFLFLDGTNEKIRIAGKQGTSWTVERGYAGTTKSVHAQGAKMRAACPAIEVTTQTDFVWRYLDDPHGVDTTNAYWIQDDGMSNIHRVARDPWDIGAGWAARKGTFADGNFAGPITLSVGASPVFSGVYAGADGNGYQKHPSFENWNASEASRKNWFLDLTPFIGGLPPSGETVSGPLAGTTYIYKSAPSVTYARNFKKSPYIGLSGPSVLLDISGPGSILGDSTSDHYKFCAVYKAGECRAGSLPGEAYANLPSLTYFQCRGAETEVTAADFCALHVAAFGQAVTQFGLDQAQPVPNIGRSGTSGGATYSRVLVRGLSGQWRKWGSLTNARTTPDGRWLVFPAAGGMSAGLIPETPVLDSTDRAEFVPLPIALPARSEAVKTILEFGYDPSQNFWCTQRHETCVVDSTSYNPAEPYKFAQADTIAGADCSEGCTLTIPAVSGRVVYYRWKYRAADGSALGTGATMAVIAP